MLHFILLLLIWFLRSHIQLFSLLLYRYVCPIHDHDISLHLFASSSVSFISVLQFSVFRSFITFFNLFLMYFIVYNATGNGLFSWFLSDCLWDIETQLSSLYWFLYPATLLNLLVSSNSLFFVCGIFRVFYI